METRRAPPTSYHETWITAFTRALCACSVFAAITYGCRADAANLSVIAPNAVKEVAMAAAARYESASGDRVLFTWSGSEAIAKRVADGEAFDVVVNTPLNIDALAAAGRVVPGSRTDFVRSAIGVAVREGASPPDVSTDEALRNALRNAKAIGLSSGPSGRYLTELFRRLGVADEVQNKIRQPPSGVQIADLLARGEVDLGFQQVAELQHASGVRFVGPLPKSLQSYTVYSAGVHKATALQEPARAFLKILVSPELRPIIKEAGMEPVGVE